VVQSPCLEVFREHGAVVPRAMAQGGIGGRWAVGLGDLGGLLQPE